MIFSAYYEARVKYIITNMHAVSLSRDNILFGKITKTM